MPRKKKTQEQPEQAEKPVKKTAKSVLVKNPGNHVTNVGGVCFKPGEEIDISKIGEDDSDYSRLQYAIKIGVLVKV